MRNEDNNTGGGQVIKPVLQNVIEKDPLQNLTSIYANIAKSIATILPIFILYTGLFGTLRPHLQRSAFLLCILCLIFIIYPLRKGEVKKQPSLIDLLLCLMVVSSVIWIWINQARILWRIPFFDPIYVTDVIFAVFLIIAVLEACRRVMGFVLVIITGSFLLYAVYGRYLPGFISHPGVSPTRLMELLYFETDGLFSYIVGMGATFIFTLIMFGTFLSRTDLGDLMFSFVQKITRNTIGAPAKMAVLSSAAMAMISGSTIANVITTGSVTIPLMIKTGFKRHVAAAFETAASTGGQITPPIMGAGIFIMSELAGVPLIDLLLMSFLPAALYYVSVYTFINITIQRVAFAGEIKVDVMQNDISLLKELLQRGQFLIPIILLVGMLLYGFSPHYASSVSVIALILVSYMRKSTRMGFNKIIEGLQASTYSALMVSSILACAALVVGVILSTGFAIIASSAVINLSHGILFYAILLTMLVSYVLGMGLPTTAAYIIVAILGVPAFLKLGEVKVVSHMAVFWFAQLATISPPVCMTAYVAADMAGASRYKTGFTALKYAKGLYLVPFLFFYTPLLTGSWLERLTVFFYAAVGLFCFAIFLEGFWVKQLSIMARIIAIILSTACFYASMHLTPNIGLPIIITLLIVFLINKLTTKIRST